jgi:hypothetical protein
MSEPGDVLLGRVELERAFTVLGAEAMIAVSIGGPLGSGTGLWPYTVIFDGDHCVRSGGVSAAFRSR